MVTRTRTTRPLLAWGTFGLLSLAAISFDAVYVGNMVGWVSAPFRGWLYSVSGDSQVVAVTYGTMLWVFITGVWGRIRATKTLAGAPLEPVSPGE